mgnify:CR=1 FL=1
MGHSPPDAPRAAAPEERSAAVPRDETGAFPRDETGALPRRPLGKTGVECADRAGFIVNFLLFPYLNDAVRMHEEGYSTPEDIESDYPLTVSVGDASYRAEYDLERNQVTLCSQKGSRREAPPLGYLPKFPGLRILVDGPRGVTVLRARVTGKGGNLDEPFARSCKFRRSIGVRDHSPERKNSERRRREVRIERRTELAVVEVTRLAVAGLEARQ